MARWALVPAPTARPVDRSPDERRGAPPGRLAPHPRPGHRRRPRGLAATVSEEEVHAIATQLRCVVCQNLSVADSPSEMARQMRDLIRERLAAGTGPSRSWPTSSSATASGSFWRPRRAGLNLLLWLAPFGAVRGRPRGGRDARAALAAAPAHRRSRRRRPPSARPSASGSPPSSSAWATSGTPR